MTAEHGEHHEFQTEIKQLLDLLVYSLYTKKEIFLRELISNASDALEKIRYLLLTDQSLPDRDLPLEIRIDLDTENKTITVTDTGIGMSRDDLITNLGTIARSGSLDFVRRLVGEDKDRATKEVDLIGQFGVGFYSAFMVASEIRVRSRAHMPDAVGVEWVSDGSGRYTVRELDKSERGTSIELALKEDAADFLDPNRIREIVKTYSHFVGYPILVNGDQVNELEALWMRPPGELSDDDYAAFYRFLTGSTESPAAHLHIQSDAPLAVRSVLYFPASNLERLGLGKMEHGLQLYTAKVLIQRECRDLLPDYLRFVRGVVDSEDISLNVSREMVQDSRVIGRIKKLLTKKVLARLGELRDHRRKDYEKIYEEFGRILREGVATEFDQRKTLAELLLFISSESPDTPVTLKEYKERMREGQEEIYYLSGPDVDALKNNPHMEMFRSKGIEVLYLTDPVDDFVLAHLLSFEDKRLVSADTADPAKLDAVTGPADGEDTPAKETMAEQSAFDHLIERVKKILGDKVLDVRPSKRLTESPCILVSPEGGASAQVQKVMSMLDKGFVPGKRILELNGRHVLIKALAKRNQEDPSDALVETAAEQLYDGALLQEGIMPDPARLVPRIHRILEEAARSGD